MGNRDNRILSRELVLDALPENLPRVQSFVTELLEEAACPMKVLMQIDVIVEEVFVNIAHYAYGERRGKAAVRVEVSGEPAAATITFTDRGMPYDPLSHKDPDTTLPASERPIGGLGIMMVRKIADSVSYERVHDRNYLTVVKTWRPGA